jgi:uncharacterized protein (DUF1684 family)
MNSATRPGDLARDPRAVLYLADYRRQVADLYAEVRRLDPRTGHEVWQSGRDHLFATHPQSAIQPESRDGFTGLPLYDYDPALRFECAVEPVEPLTLGLPHSGSGTTPAYSFGTVTFTVESSPVTLTLFWLDEYGGGIFLPFRDLTNGTDTYGGGRYLLDTAKGADLGSTETSITLDFNFAYHPSCVHDSRWSCPLSTPQNHLDVAIRGGERLR